MCYPKAKETIYIGHGKPPPGAFVLRPIRPPAYLPPVKWNQATPKGGSLVSATKKLVEAMQPKR